MNQRSSKDKRQLPLPETLYWHSATIFTNRRIHGKSFIRGAPTRCDPAEVGLRTIVDGERFLFLSNEALRKDRHPDCFWCIGPTKHVLFDEAHFGIVERRGSGAAPQIPAVWAAAA